MATFGGTAVKITSSGYSKQFIKMSHDHTKFAYLTNGAIEIVDNKGVQIAFITQYSKIKSFDWSTDDKTLYILSNDTMYYYGPAMSLPAISYPGIIAGYSTEILGASVSMKGDFAYIIHAWAYSYADIYKLIVVPANGSAIVSYDNSNSTYPMFSVNFSNNQQDLTLCYKDLHQTPDNIQAIDFFTGLGKYPDFHYESSESYITPVYKSNLGLMLVGYNTGSYGSPNMLSIRDVVTGNNSQVLNQYTVTGNGLYCDWK